MSADQPSLSRSELAALEVLWRLGPSTVREVWSALQNEDWVYTTVQTLLQRLEAKGFATSEKHKRVRVYRAARSRDEIVRDRLDELSRELCNGSSLPLLHGLVDGQLSATEISELRGMLDRLEREGKRSERRARKGTEP